MDTRRTPQQATLRNLVTSIAFAVTLAAACFSGTWAQESAPSVQQQAEERQADIIFGWTVRQYRVLGPIRVQAVSPTMMTLYASPAPIGVVLKGKRISVMDRFGNPLGLDQLKPGVTVHLAAKGDELKVMIVPTVEQTDFATGEAQ